MADTKPRKENTTRKFTRRYSVIYTRKIKQIIFNQKIIVLYDDSLLDYVCLYLVILSGIFSGLSSISIYLS